MGQPDVDCINNAICCFDGYANVCQVEEVQGKGQGLLFPPPELQGQQNENTGPDGGYGASPSVSTKVENGQTFTPAAVASNNDLQGQSRVTQSQTQRPFIK